MIFHLCCMNVRAVQCASVPHGTSMVSRIEVTHPPPATGRAHGSTAKDGEGGGQDLANEPRLDELSHLEHLHSTAGLGAAAGFGCTPAADASSTISIAWLG